MTLPKSFEQEIKDYFNRKDIRFSDGSSAYDQLDFTIMDRNGQPVFHLEVKEKRQQYNPKNWFPFAPEVDMFVLDDLTVRKCLAYAPGSGVMVRDNFRGKYFFFSIVDLALMPRLRINRPINRRQPALKGKWLINLRNGKRASSLDKAIFHVRYYLRDLDETLFETLECYGKYVDEDIHQSGIVRRPLYWDTDVQSTR